MIVGRSKAPMRLIRRTWDWMAKTPRAVPVRRTRRPIVFEKARLTMRRIASIVRVRV